MERDERILSHYISMFEALVILKLLKVTFSLEQTSDARIIVGMFDEENARKVLCEVNNFCSFVVEYLSCELLSSNLLLRLSKGDRFFIIILKLTF